MASLIDKYLIKHDLTENVVVRPSWLNFDLFNHIREHLTTKYVNKLYKNVGHVLSITDVEYLTNNITNSQTIITVKFKAMLYTPEISHSFRVPDLKKNFKHYWVPLGPVNVFIPDTSKVPSFEGTTGHYLVTITNVKSDLSICLGVVIKEKV